MSKSSTEGVAAPATPDEAGENQRTRTRLIESIFDNLSLWTVLAAAISFLYLVWATLDVLGRYLGGIPSVGP